MIKCRFLKKKYVDIFILYYIDDDVKFDIRMVLCRLRIPKFVSHQLWGGKKSLKFECIDTDTMQKQFFSFFIPLKPLCTMSVAFVKLQ